MASKTPFVKTEIPNQTNLAQAACDVIPLPYTFTAEKLIAEGRTTRSNVEEIQKWLDTISFQSLPEEMIVLFLIACNNDIKVTQNSIKAYFRVKNAAPEIFFNRNVDMEDLQKAMNVVIISCIPVRMPDNVVVYFTKLADTDYKKFDMTAVMKLGFMLIDVSHRYSPPNEMISIIDMKGSSLMHMTRLQLSAVRKFIEFVQEAMPLRLQRVHILNANFVFERTLALARIFMKSELISKIMPHSPNMKMEDFHRNFVPAAYLPEEYGGELPNCEELHKETMRQFREMKEFYEAEEKLVKCCRVLK